MKKITLLIAFIMSVSVAIPFVTGISTFESNQENLIGLGITMNEWQLIPTIGTGIEYLNPDEDVPSQITNTNNYNVTKESYFRFENVKYAYVFDAQTRKYVLAIKEGKLTGEFDSSMAKADRAPVMWVYVETTPKEYGTRWLWLNEKKTETSVSEFTMKKGWNFIYTTNDMIGKSLSEWKGTCTVTKLAGYDYTEGWNVADVDKMNFENVDHVGIPILLKVDKDCKFEASSSVPAPPAFPN